MKKILLLSLMLFSISKAELVYRSSDDHFCHLPYDARVNAKEYNKFMWLIVEWTAKRAAEGFNIKAEANFWKVQLHAILLQINTFTSVTLYNDLISSAPGTELRTI